MGKQACSGVGALRAEALILVVRNREDHPRWPRWIGPHRAGLTGLL